MKLLRALFLLVVSCRVLAFPLAYKSTVISKTYVPLIVISISVFFLLVVIKLVYMKHRIGTVHAPPRVHSIPTGSNLSSSTSSFGFRDKQGSQHRGFLVGCLGSPTWETDLTLGLEVATWRPEQRRKPPFVYQRHTGSTIRSASARTKSKNASSSSRLTKSTVLTGCSADANQSVLPLSSGYSRIPTARGGRLLGSVQRTGYGDFGESRDVRLARGSVPKATRRASPSSIRLIHGPSYSSQVEYSFLSGLPPDATAVSPLMGTRDSFQLSRCSLKCNRKAVPPLPPLPSFLPFHLPENSESFSPEGSRYLPPLRFSPLVGVAKVFHSQQSSSQIANRGENGNVPDLKISCAASILASSKAENANDTRSVTSASIVQDTPLLHIIRKTNHTKSQPHKDLAIERTSPRTNFVALECDAKESMQTSALAPSSTSCNDSVGSRKPLKSCLRQNSVATVPSVCSPEFMPTPFNV